MTPTWRKMMKYALAKAGAEKGREHIRRLAACRCFDLREVEDLMRITAPELRKAASISEDGFEVRIDLGDKAIMPADDVFLEWRGGGAKLHRQGGSDDYAGALLGQDPPFIRGGMVLFVDPGFFAVSLMAGGEITPTLVRDLPKDALDAAFMVLAGLAVINSPSARRCSVEPHKGLSRDIRAVGCQPPQIKHTRVILYSARLGMDGIAKSSSNPKAYHFCRAHRRELGDGRWTKVRAHWRGDPAFGYRLPSYTVKEPQLDDA